MLRTRVATALILLALLLSVLFSQSYVLFLIVACAFFGAAAWESFRMFGSTYPRMEAALWAAALALILFAADFSRAPILFGLCVAIWAIRLAPSLAVGLPPVASFGNRLLNGVYGISILGCFVAIAEMFARSPAFLLSVMAIVWVADIGAYFAGKAFGKRKLAPSISPGKSWEGAIGGWIAVLAIAAATAMSPHLDDTFAPRLIDALGWMGFLAVMTLLVAASIVGDLFESQLKRRAGMKDSSALLPGHGGVLDRIDALIPALPLAGLIGNWL